jgi:hypothetical protein
MHRQPLLDQLADYATRHPDEAETVARFIACRKLDDPDGAEKPGLVIHLPMGGGLPR